MTSKTKSYKAWWFPLYFSLWDHTLCKLAAMLWGDSSCPTERPTWKGTEASCPQPYTSKLDVFKVDPLSPVKPSDDGSPGQDLDDEFERDTESEPPR